MRELILFVFLSSVLIVTLTLRLILHILMGVALRLDSLDKTYFNCQNLVDMLQVGLDYSGTNIQLATNPKNMGNLRGTEHMFHLDFLGQEFLYPLWTVFLPASFH